MTTEQALKIKAALEAAGKTSSPIYEQAIAALRKQAVPQNLQGPGGTDPPAAA